MISKGKKKVFRSIHGGSLSLCKVPAGQNKRTGGPRIWPAGRSLPMSGIGSTGFIFAT